MMRTAAALCVVALVATAAAQKSCAPREEYSPSQDSCVCRDGLIRVGGDCVVSPMIQTQNTPEDGSMLHLAADRLMHTTWDEEAGAMVQMDLMAMIRDGSAAREAITDDNSGPCRMDTMGTVRFHQRWRRLEVCATALRPDDYFWHPVGAPPGCYLADDSDPSKCAYCHRGLVVSGGRCLEAADVLHLTFEKSLEDLSNNGRDGFLVNPDAYNLLENEDAPEGNYALDLDGQDTHVTIPPFTMGGPNGLTICSYVKYNAFNGWSRIMDFASGAPTDNILIANIEGSPNARFEYFSGATKLGELTIPGFWATARGGWVHACFTVDQSNIMKAYRNGELMRQVQANGPVPEVQRVNNYIGNSNWDADGDTHAAIDDFRIYSRALTAEEIAAMSCNNDRFCEGLLGHWRFEQNLLDTSISGWHGTGHNTHPLNAYTRAYVAGNYALRLDGTDDYVSLPPRMMGGDISVCGHVRFDGFPGWSRIIDFGNGEGIDNIILAQEGGTRNLRWEVYTDQGPSLFVAVEDGLWRADGASIHICATTSDTNMKVYINGRLAGENPEGRSPRMVLRNNNYIGRSNYANDAHFEGVMDSIRIYDRALTSDEVQQLRCWWHNATLDCVGMLGHYRFEGNALDSSGSGWHGDVVRAAQTEMLFTPPDDKGNQMLNILGQDAYLRLRPRAFGGAMSVCAMVKLLDVQFWARLIDFGDGPEANNILIANIENSDRLAFHVLNGGERVATLEIDDFWAPAREEMVHVCFTLGENGRAEAYVNGESKGSSLDNGLPDILTRANMFVGKSNWPDEAQHAAIDDLRIYEYALSGDEVASLYDLVTADMA